MKALTIVSDTQHQLRPLLEAAIENEVRFLEAGLRKTKDKIRAFENQYKLTTPDFLSRYENDELKESIDFENWIGESRLLDRIDEKITALRGIRFEN